MQSTTFINLTPHPICFQKLDTSGMPHTVTLPPTRPTCRVATESHERDTVSGVPLQWLYYGEVTNLPAPKPHTVYIVSNIVLTALRMQGIHRPDVVAPATGARDGALRTDDGKVAAITRFNALPEQRLAATA